MEIKSKNYAKIGFFICAISVMFGAMGKHLIEDVVSSYYLDVFETAVRYQFIHGLAISFLALNYRKLNDKYLQYILPLFIFSILVFSGTLYVLVLFSAFFGDEFKWLGAFTPLGGAGFILGWIMLGIKGFDSTDNSTSNDNSSPKRRHKRHRSSGSHRTSENSNS